MPFKFLFCGKAEKESYQVLDYSHRNLMSVPTDIYDHAHTLQELYLDANQLKDLPKALFTLQHLKLLNVGDNEIAALPPNVSNLVHLLEFDISKNGFLELPDNIKGMKSLQTFDLSVNPLGRLPDGFTMLVNLTHVYLNDTFLDFLPANIGRMAKLVVLEVRDNHLTMIPKSMCRLTELRRLDIGHNEFTELPEVVGTFVNLQELWLDANEIKCIPSDVGNLQNLQYIDASENKIEWLCGEIGFCHKLTDLHLTTNCLTQLPENLCKLKMLETLKVDDNCLSNLPTSLGGLSNLRELICSRNELKTLPPGIGLLRRLQTLNVDDNFIDYLPDEIGSCTGLTIVSLRQNRLVYLPDEVGRLANLVVFSISSNMLEHLPYSMMKLKKLQALWLSENQAKPLIPLQTDWDPVHERRFLTCYMFPQRPLNDVDNSDNEEDTGEDPSFHTSMFEEEWRKRTSVLFDLDDEDPLAYLNRQPLPKDGRDRVTQLHAKGRASHQSSTQDVNDSGTNIASGAKIAPYCEPYPVHMKTSDHLSEEEMQLLNQLQNTTITSSEAGTNIERQRMQDTVLKYQNNVRRLNEDGHLVSPTPNHPFNDQLPPAYHSALDLKPNVKLSSDSGLGSMQLNDDQNQWRNEYPTIPEQEELIRVTIKKTPHLGFSVSGGLDSPGNPFRPYDSGIFITKILPDGPAYNLLLPGDKVLEVNSTDFTSIKHEHAVSILKSCQEVVMVLSRRCNDNT